MATIAVLGTLDTKGPEHAFIAAEIQKRGHTTMLIDVGTGAPATIEHQVTRDEVAVAVCEDVIPNYLLAQQTGRRHPGQNPRQSHCR